MYSTYLKTLRFDFINIIKLVVSFWFQIIINKLIFYLLFKIYIDTNKTNNSNL